MDPSSVTHPNRDLHRLRWQSYGTGGEISEQFASLLRGLPELRVLVCSGCTDQWLRGAGLGALLDSERGTPRIEMLGLPFHPQEFFATIARQLGPSQTAHGDSVID